ncbi:MAG TPA: peptidase, partial [Arthrobacter bacterium]|nr:peptidase [Arthrobacter sp.]
FAAGTSVTGRVPAAPTSAVAAHSKVRITVAGQQPLEVPVYAGGNWSFNAPEAPGTFTFSAETVNGFS